MIVATSEEDAIVQWTKLRGDYAQLVQTYTRKKRLQMLQNAVRYYQKLTLDKARKEWIDILREEGWLCRQCGRLLGDRLDPLCPKCEAREKPKEN